MGFVTSKHGQVAAAVGVIGGDARWETESHSDDVADGLLEVQRREKLEAARAEAQREQQALGVEHEAARQAGYAEGRKAGWEAGLAEAHVAAEASLAAERHATTHMVKVLTEPWKALQTDLSDAITDAAMTIAQAVVGHVRGAGVAALKRAVVEVLAESEQIRGGRNTLKIHVHPKNTARVVEWTQAAGAEVVADERLGMADMRAELARADDDPADRIDWDATLETRWQAIRRTLRLAK